MGLNSKERMWLLYLKMSITEGRGRNMFLRSTYCETRSPLYQDGCQMLGRLPTGTDAAKLLPVAGSRIGLVLVGVARLELHQGS